MRSIDKDVYLESRNKDYDPGWSIINNDSQGYTALTPNKVSIQLIEDDDFRESPQEQYQSTMLWYHSLAWLKVIEKEFKDRSFINNSIMNYHRFMMSDAAEEVYSTLTSRDHLVAEQIRSITYLLATGFVEHVDECQEMLLHLLEWGMIPENVKDNNHGMMLVASMLHIPLFCKIDNETSVEEYATAHLQKIISGAFDTTGLCKENSPLYHKFYITYIDRLINELDIIADPNLSIHQELKKIRDLAQHALLSISLPDGSLPPFGDGNLTPPIYKETKESTEFFSKESGFFCSKTGHGRKKYFSMSCGYSSTTHKHVDDTSIFYWFDGQPIITDAGFFNYDWQDPRTLAVKSQRGHSGAFFNKFDDIYPAAMYREGAERVESTLDLKHENHLKKLVGECLIDGKFKTIREVRFSHLNNIIVSDKFIGDTSEGVVSRYLIPESLSVRNVEDGITISNDQFEMFIKIKGGSYTLSRGLQESSEPRYGWEVDEPYSSLKPCWELSISPSQGSFTVTTNLLLTEKTTGNSVESDILKRLEALESALPQKSQTTQFPASVDTKAQIDPSAKLIANPVIGEYSKIYRECEITKATIGKRCTINRGVTVRPEVVIGDDVQIGAFSMLMTDDHEISESRRRAGKFFVNPITVENGVWIGTNATILGGVTIGYGSIVAAGAVVTKDVPSNTIVAGVPAKVIRTIDS